MKTFTNIFILILGIIIGFHWSKIITNVLTANEFINSEQSLTINGKIKDVHDGDTVTVSLTKEFKVRLLDCWAAELKDEDVQERIKAEKAKNFLASMLKVDDEVSIEIPIYDSLEKSLTFGRVLAYIWKDLDGDGHKENISEEMVEHNHATKHKVKKDVSN